MKLQLGHFNDIVAVGLHQNWVSLLQGCGDAYTFQVLPERKRHVGVYPIEMSGFFGVITSSQKRDLIPGLTLKGIRSVKVTFDRNYPEDNFHTRELRITNGLEVSFIWELFCNGTYVDDGRGAPST